VIVRPFCLASRADVVLLLLFFVLLSLWPRHQCCVSVLQSFFQLLATDPQ